VLSVEGRSRDEVPRPAGATTLFRVIADMTDQSNSRDSAQVLAVLLVPASGPAVPLRAASVTCCWGGPAAHRPALADRRGRAAPCRRSTQQLVEVLKLPACVDEKRRLVLDRLGHRYQRRFANLWECVAWGKEHKPELDLTTPPQRPRQ
jgi:hypothetical protein